MIWKVLRYEAICGKEDRIHRGRPDDLRHCGRHGEIRASFPLPAFVAEPTPINGQAPAETGVGTLPNDRKTNSGARSLIESCDILVLAVKPQSLDALLAGVADGFRPDQLVVSVISGVNLDRLEQRIKSPVVRVMPNTPMLVGAGVAGIVPRQSCTPAQVLEGGSHPAQLKESVCSPGGSTIAGVHSLEKNGLRSAVMDAIIAGKNRVKEIEKDCS
jgi:pyrroline-5-carboxylate reductase